MLAARSRSPRAATSWRPGAWWRRGPAPRWSRIPPSPPRISVRASVSLPPGDNDHGRTERTASGAGPGRAETDRGAPDDGGDGPAAPGRGASARRAEVRLLRADGADPRAAADRVPALVAGRGVARSPGRPYEP